MRKVAQHSFVTLAMCIIANCVSCTHRDCSATSDRIHREPGLLVATVRVNERSQSVDFVLENHGKRALLVGRSMGLDWIVKSGSEFSTNFEMSSGQWGEPFRDGLELLPPLTAATKRERARDAGLQIQYSIPRQVFEGGEAEGNVSIRMSVPASTTLSKPLATFHFELPWPLIPGAEASGSVNLPFARD